MVEGQANIDKIDIEAVISGANSVRGALFRLGTSISHFSNCALAYEFFIWPWSYIRGDLLNATTLPVEVINLYYPSGGTNTDPIIDKVAKRKPFIEMDLSETLLDKSSKYHGNPFFIALHEQGCVSLAAYCLSGNGMIGYSAFTVFETEEQRSRRPGLEDMQRFLRDWHQTLLQTGLLGSHFQLSEKELAAIEAAAAGRTAEDVATRENVSPRTVELRLQSARNKLNARSTTEAVYKAVAFGLLPLSK